MMLKTLKEQMNKNTESHWQIDCFFLLLNQQVPRDEIN